MSHQTNPVRLVRVEVIHNVSIPHQLRNNRKCFILRADADTEMLQDIRMVSIHPKHRFLAEVLYSGFHVSRQNLNRTLRRVPTFRIFLSSRATRILFSHCPAVQYSLSHICEPAAGENCFFNTKASAPSDQVTVWDSVGVSCESAKRVETAIGKFLLESTAPQSLVFNGSVLSM